MWGRKKQDKEEIQEKEIPKIRIKENPKPVEEAEKQEVPARIGGEATIVAVELLDKGFRTIIVSDKPMGQVGETFEI